MRNIYNQNHKHFLPEQEIDIDLENLEFTQDSYINDLNHYEIFLKKFKNCSQQAIHKESNKYSQSTQYGGADKKIIDKLHSNTFRLLDEIEVQDPLLDNLLRHRDTALNSQIYNDKYVMLEKHLH